MVGMARRAVPARVVAGGTNIRATLASKGVAPLHAARTSQRDVPTSLNRYLPVGQRQAASSALNAQAASCRSLRFHPASSALSIEPANRCNRQMQQTWLCL